jgi:cell division protein FtsB
MIKSFFNQYISKLPKPLRNKYIVVLIVFVLWLSIFDKNSLFKQYQLQATLAELKEKHSFYKSEINKDSIKTLELSSDDKNLEKFAREEHLMKRDDEDVFIFVEKKKQ